MMVAKAQLTSACLSKFHEKPCYYLLIILHKNVRDNCDSSFNLRL
jgi:hypothetical protein